MIEQFVINDIKDKFKEGDLLTGEGQIEMFPEEIEKDGMCLVENQSAISSPITSENYVEHVLRTDSPLTMELQARLTDPDTIRLIHAAMGMVTESAELMDMLKKHIFYGKSLDLVNAKEEIGDNQWYVGLAVDVIRTTMNEVLTVNINKLRLRYPEKFTGECAINRDVNAERTLLEQTA